MVKRFYVAPEDIHGEEAVLRGKEAHHAARVMRMKAGEPLTLFDGKGHEYQGIIQKILNGEMSVLLEKHLEEGQDGAQITVACAIPKRLRMERVIEKLTEMGTEAILPFSAERTVPRVKREEEAKKILRFKTIAAQAAKQCGVSRLPDLSRIFSFTEILGLSGAYDLALFLAPEGRPLPECLKGKRAKRVIVAVGPEGGWSPKELHEAKNAGWELASFGKRILKVDTACLAAVAVLHYALDPLEK